ncbi:flagellar basal body P-ring formation chaperone FlgA [Thiorhodospira sibirica]|uniref:flagellar basal body P-ring formation chaperone FlgA n=1 Tax=Thiorhodospira sibirica TaxID=154347 RepID=UPI00022C58BB|nr:flagellar basal body P-ring formation chaperone FlgA [Thiorhodospira sibirica]
MIRHTMIAIVAYTLLSTLAHAALASTAEHESHETIRQTAEAFIYDEARKTHGADFNIEVDVSRLDARLRLRACSQPLEAFLAPGGRTTGSTTVGISCSAPAPWSLYIPVTVGVSGEVLVAARSLPRGTVLAAQDIRLERRDITRLTSGYLSDPVAVRSMVLRRAVASGTTLIPNMLEAQRMVQRGQNVVLLAQSDNFSIRMSGEALGDAAYGELVKVRNRSSRRVVEGVVVSAGVVSVNL